MFPPMQEVHRSLALVVVAVAASFTVAAFVAARLQGAPPWLEWLRRTVIVLIALEALAGAVLYGGGHRPEESLHLLYGGAALVLIPFGSYFAAEAPPRPRAFVLGITGFLTLAIFFRSFVTG